jgi:hypothetical protein
MKPGYALILFFAATCAVIAAEKETPPPAAPLIPGLLDTLKKEHPRLLISAQGFATLKDEIAGSERLKQWFDKLHGQAEKMLAEKPSIYELPDGVRLLMVSRRVLERVTLLALIYRLDGDRRFADRAWSELEAAANFQDWHPVHFLDTAEMTCAFAIGYDWLYDVWTPEQRTTLRHAMVEKGLKPALGVYRRADWWAVANMNWNQVCNGGIGLGALALAEDEPALAGEILNDAIKSLPLAMREFGPDGAWSEGPGYWQYATDYNVRFLAALDSALGTDFGLSKIPGFDHAGAFPIYFTGTTGEMFNYADVHPGKFGGAPQLFWLAQKFDQPSFAAFQMKYADADPKALDLVWGAAWEARKPQMGTYPLDRYFRNAEIVTMRGAWDDPQAVFIGFKAGPISASHGHLDLGSFVLDALGKRWAVDPGSDDYNLPAYFGKQRWTYYRLRAEAHNTLVINPGAGPDQNPNAKTRITRFESKPQRAFAIADLSEAYAPAADKVERGILFSNRRDVLVQDEISAPAPADVRWFFHTPASIEVNADGTSATLRQGKETMFVTLLSKEPAARFEVQKSEPLPTSPHPEKQASNDGVQTLTLHFTGVRQLQIVVLFSPDPAVKNSAEQKIKPLAEW